MKHETTAPGAHDQPTHQHRPAARSETTAAHQCSSGKHGAAPGHDQGAAAAALRDPVCGMTVAEDSQLFVVHEGERYVFCSAGCRSKFSADPGKYLTRAEAPSAKTVEAPAGTIYTCPMHPEIEQDHPGDCPKCGMALE